MGVRVYLGVLDMKRFENHCSRTALPAYVEHVIYLNGPFFPHILHIDFRELLLLEHVDGEVSWKARWEIYRGSLGLVHVDLTKLVVMDRTFTVCERTTVQHPVGLTHGLYQLKCSVKAGVSEFYCF